MRNVTCRVEHILEPQRPAPNHWAVAAWDWSAVGDRLGGSDPVRWRIDAVSDRREPGAAFLSACGAWCYDSNVGYTLEPDRAGHIKGSAMSSLALSESTSGDDRDEFKGDDRYDDELFEIVTGRRITTDPMGTRQCYLASKLCTRLTIWAEANHAGWVVVETLFDLGLKSGNQRRPDLAFVSFERWPAEQSITDDDGWPVVPDLAVEVVSRSNRGQELLEKTLEYFDAGVKQVWLIYPKSLQVHVFESPTRVRILGCDDELSSPDCLPGLKLRLADLFA